MQKKFLLLGCMLIIISAVNAQHVFKALVKDKTSNLPIADVSIQLKNQRLGTVTDSLGMATLTGIPSGKQIIVFTSVGYEPLEWPATFPGNGDIIEIFLEPGGDELEEVIVKSTRTSRTIKNVPTRVEVIDAEELDEKSNMRPSNVSMLLHESTGIQVQQTSATSANASIRIQGLDGRYTQILKDGIPNYGGFSGGLSILEIPPLDLKQVEVIKGPASTLYGGGAIAGVINFISIEPGKDNYTRLLLNQSHIGQSNAAVFTVQRKNNIGYTILATGNLQRAYDVDEDDFTELPQSRDFTLSPKLFFYINDKTQLDIGHTLITGDRRGGDIQVVRKRPDAQHVYFENNKTLRNTTNIKLETILKNNSRLMAKQSIGFFKRSIEIPGYRFKGLQTNSYTDLSYIQQLKEHTLVTGVNFIYDNFKEDKTYSGQVRDERNVTGGLYIQDNWDASEKVLFENGLRVDVTDKYGVFVLPRFTLLYKIGPAWSSRAGFGLGYKLPTIFTEQTESVQYRLIEPLSNVKAERSYGGTADINFTDNIADELQLSVNHMFFYTVITRPLVLRTGVAGYFFDNANENTHTFGFETNAKLIYRDAWKLFAGYTLNETRAKWLKGNTFLPLVPKSKLNLALIYEKHDFLKIGLEGYRTGKQHLSNGQVTPAFWEFGCMAEKPFKRFSVFINAENFTDMRQSNYKRVVNEPHENPTFDEIWNHTEGFVVNGGVKIRL